MSDKYQQISSFVFSSHADLQDAFDADWQAGRLNSVGYLNGTEDGILAYKLLIQTGSEKDPFNYSLVCFPDSRNSDTGSYSALRWCV